jgi:hypothetical protein
VVDALFSRGPDTFGKPKDREIPDGRQIGIFTMSDMAQVLYALSNFTVRPPRTWFDLAYNWMTNR